MISPGILRRYPYFAGLGEETLKAVAMIADVWKAPASNSQPSIKGP